METSRDDVGIAIRSAFLRKGTQQRYSLFALSIISILLIFLETIEVKPLNKVRSIINDLVYRGAVVVSYPSKVLSNSYSFFEGHIKLYDNYNKLKKENNELKSNISNSDFLVLENSQLKELINEQIPISSNIVAARAILDKQSPYLNSFVINVGNNKNIKNGFAVLDGKNFIGRIVDVNYFSSRVLLATDLNSKIPIMSEPSGSHAIMSGHGKSNPSLEYLSLNHNIKDGDKIYTSGKEGIFAPGIPIGEAKTIDNNIEVLLFSDLNQITFINIDLGKKNRK